MRHADRGPSGDRRGDGNGLNGHRCRHPTRGPRPAPGPPITCPASRDQSPRAAPGSIPACFHLQAVVGANSGARDVCEWPTGTGLESPDADGRRGAGNSSAGTPRRCRRQRSARSAGTRRGPRRGDFGWWRTSTSCSASRSRWSRRDGCGHSRTATAASCRRTPRHYRGPDAGDGAKLGSRAGDSGRRSGADSPVGDGAVPGGRGNSGGTTPERRRLQHCAPHPLRPPFFRRLTLPCRTIGASAIVI